MGAQIGRKFLCPHCSRLGGKIGGTVQGLTVCTLCSKDYGRVRELMKLIHRAIPKTHTQGRTVPELVALLFIGWAKLKGLNDLANEAKVLTEVWRKRDDLDRSEVAARKGRDPG